MTRGRAPRSAPAAGWASPRERMDGIGYRWSPAPAGWNEDPMASRHSEARAGAAAMRSRDFRAHWYRMEAQHHPGVHPGDVQAIGETPVVAGDSRYVCAWPEELRRGCPAWPQP